MSISSTISSWWKSFVASFKSSETILWARVQMAAGAVWIALQATDLSPVLSSKVLTYWLIFSGAVTEFLRRRGTETSSSGQLVPKQPPST